MTISDNHTIDDSADRDTTGRGAEAGLVEREHELRTLRHAIDEARAGRNCLVLVEGPSGIGKSRLLHEAEHLGREAGLLTTRATGSPLERAFPHGIIRQFADSMKIPIDPASDLFSGPAAAAKPVFEQFSETEALPSMSGFGVLQSLATLARRVGAAGPWLVLLDDAHWCDQPSLELLAYLARRPPPTAVAAVIGFRPCASTTASAALRELLCRPDRIALAPQPLTSAGVMTVIESRLGRGTDPLFAEACRELSGGNPLLLEEMMKESQLSGVTPTPADMPRLRRIAPRAASRSVLLRLWRLDAEARALARTLAIIGTQVPFDLVAELAGLDLATTQRAYARLAEAEIVHATGRMEFVHPIFQEAIYQDIVAIEASAMHLKAAQRFNERNLGSERVAAQLLPAPPQGQMWVVRALRRAAAEALSRGAADSAARYLRRALQEPPAEEMMLDIVGTLGAAEILMNDAKGVEHLEQAYELADDPKMKALIASALGRGLICVERTEESASLLRRARDRVAEISEPLAEHLNAILTTVSVLDRGAVPWAEVSTLIAKLEQHDPFPRNAALVRGIASLGLALRNEPRERCEHLAHEAVRDGSLFDLSGDAPTIIAALTVLSVADSEHADDACARAVQITGTNGSAYGSISARGCRGYLLTIRGRLTEAVQVLEGCSNDVKLFNVNGAGSAIAACHGLALIEQGRLDDAERALSAIKPFEALPEGVMSAMWLSVRLRLLCEQGHYQATIEAGTRLMEREAGIVVNPSWPEIRQPMIVALVGLGRVEEAYVLASETIELARAWGAPRAIGKALRLRGQINHREGLADFEEACQILEGSNARLEYARALAARGTALRLLRRPAEARQPLERAVGFGTRCGAVAFVTAARAELAAAGGSAMSVRGQDALTPAELRVARLAADGRSNREIAQQLFIAPKTVEVHLSRAYRKLSIGSRRQLRIVLDRTDLV